MTIMYLSTSRKNMYVDQTLTQLVFYLGKKDLLMRADIIWTHSSINYSKLCCLQEILLKNKRATCSVGWDFLERNRQEGESEETLGIPAVSGPVWEARQRHVRRTQRSSSDSEPKQWKSGRHGLCRWCIQVWSDKAIEKCSFLLIKMICSILEIAPWEERSEETLQEPWPRSPSCKVRSEARQIQGKRANPSSNKERQQGSEDRRDTVLLFSLLAFVTGDGQESI